MDGPMTRRATSPTTSIGVPQVAFLGDADVDLVPDVGEAARVVDDVRAQHLGVREGDERAGGLRALHRLVGTAGFPHRGVEDVDAVHVAEDLADADAVADAVVALERVEQPAGEALDGRLQRPGEGEAEEPDGADERARVAGDDAEGMPMARSQMTTPLMAVAASARSHCPSSGAARNAHHADEQRRGERAARSR
jgi:hypothetical protein